MSTAYQIALVLSVLSVALNLFLLARCIRREAELDRAMFDRPVSPAADVVLASPSVVYFDPQRDRLLVTTEVPLCDSDVERVKGRVAVWAGVDVARVGLLHAGCRITIVAEEASS